MYAATVDFMMKKARFESDTAMAVAEAFDIAIEHAQLVTIPMLDARLAEFKSGIDAQFARVDTRFVELEARIDARFAAFRSEMDERFAKIDARFLALEARVSSLEAHIKIRFALMEERLEKKLEAFKSEMVRWVFLTMLGNMAISAGVNALMNSFQHLR
jgi:hypothetical protein